MRKEQTQKRIIKAMPQPNQTAFGLMMIKPKSLSSMVVKNSGSAIPAMLTARARRLTTTSTMRNCHKPKQRSKKLMGGVPNAFVDKKYTNQ